MPKPKAWTVWFESLWNHIIITVNLVCLLTCFLLNSCTPCDNILSIRYTMADDNELVNTGTGNDNISHGRLLWTDVSDI